MTSGAADSPSGNGRLTVEDLLDRIRAEAARRRRTPSAAPAPTPLSLAPEFQHLQVLLSQAKSVADTGSKVPPFINFGPMQRALAQTVTRVLYFFLQVISVDQAVFNRLILQVVDGLLGGLRQGESGLAARLDQHVAKLADVQGRLARLDADNAALAAAVEARLAEYRRDVDARTARLHEDLAAVSAALLRPSPDAQPALSRDLAALYARFEERFRGSRESITARARDYVPIVQAAGAGTAERPVLDLGCGRGEWLEVLAEAGLHGRGVDGNVLLVDQCRGRNLDVALGDALTHLRGLPDGSIGAVTAIHFIEHLRFPTMVALIDETVRVLARGGVAIFETPNAANLLVGACSFHTDPTHELPLAPMVLQFLAEARGLARVEIRLLPRSEALPPLPDDAPAILRQIAPHVTAAEDYAVIGYRT